MGSMVAGAGVNPADQRWGFWPLLPLSYKLWKWFEMIVPSFCATGQKYGQPLRYQLTI